MVFAESFTERGFLVEQEQSLPELTYKEKELFLEIYEALVDKNVIGLFLMRRYLEEQSAKLRHVHPLSTLLFIKENPLMKEYLNQLRKKRMITEPWDRSCRDFVSKMTEHKKHQTLCLGSFLEKIEEDKRTKVNLLIISNRFIELLEFFL